VRFGAHLPLIDFDGGFLSADELREYVHTASASGFGAISANDHLVYQRPWLDGLVALSSVLDRIGEMTIATTVALPVVRGPLALAKAAIALQLLSGGCLALGIGPGSSPADYAAVGLPFEERWRLFDEAIAVLRSELAPAEVPLWVGSWGSPAGLRRVARTADGWLASAYNTTPDRLAAGRETLAPLLQARGRNPESFPVAVATAWAYLSEDRAVAHAKLHMLATMLKRDPDELRPQVLIGSAEHCTALLNSYAAAGADIVFIWPVGDPVGQLRLFGEQVFPLVLSESG
jgi:alkanesulfonate monooxygenase SsuD/methylene tetrahydromethanopterin reductase-like flavin-dependent oxidoreductase (luciferase family)